jgi:hypothetical protein
VLFDSFYFFSIQYKKKSLLQFEQEIVKSESSSKIHKLINLESLRKLSQKQYAVAGSARQEFYFVIKVGPCI